MASAAVTRLIGFIGMTLIAIAIAPGCASTHEVAILHDLAHDHTLDIVSRPVRASAKLFWRARTFTFEQTRSLWLGMVSFPRLRHRPIQELAPLREMMPPEILESYLERRTGGPYAGDVKLLIGGRAFFTRFEKALREARQSIDIQIYIFDRDDIATEIADLLLERAREIEVRVLLDSIGSRRAWGVTASSSCPENRVGVGNMIRYLRRDGLIEVRRSRNTLLSSNHFKGAVIDGRVGFMGGMNIGREYRYDWRDTMFEVRGPLLTAIEEQFSRGWHRAGSVFAKRERVGNNPAQMAESSMQGYYAVRTTPFSHHLYGAKLLAINSAQDRIYIENPYLWNRPLIYALCKARRRGVDVRVTLPARVNLGVGRRANHMVVNQLLSHGVRVYLYPGMTHVKAAVFDDWVSVGTANYDALSLHKNYEMNFMTRHPEMVRDVTENVLREGRRLSVEVVEPMRVNVFDRVALFLGEML